jgi:hypothetical protein
MNKRMGWMALWVAAVAWIPASAQAQARLIAGTETELPKLETAYGTFKLGKKPYPEGTREAWIKEGRVLAQAPEGYLPPSKMLKGAADNRSILPPIGNQGSEGSCVHWAGSYYTKSANMKRMNPSLNLSATSNQCSPRFTYNLTNVGTDNGGYGHEPFEIFMRYGVASLLQKPYTAGQYSALPTVADFVEGLHRRSTNYVWVWEWAPTSTQINQLKTFLDAGGVAACAVYAETSFDAWKKGDAPWYGTPCTISSINHMVTVVGYGTGYYLVANSWGTTFGSNGYIVVDSGYFENYFSDVMYPLEGTYEPATNYAKMSISHARRSDIRSLQFSVNGTTVWSNSPLPKNLPKGTGSFDTDSRANWQLAVDLSSATWGGANTVTSKCTDNVSGTTGSITNFTLRYAGTDYVSTNTPVSIPDNSTGGAIAVVATATATSAPSFGANPGPVTATTGVARAFTVSAGGYPVPVLALQSTTASSGHSFVPATGVLTYTPPIADIGARSFTFTASNSAGVATQTVSVTVVEAPPAAPASIWASATNTTDFTAAWSSVAEATGYRLDVATNNSFSSGGGANLMTNPGFETGDSTGWDKFETEYAVASSDPQEGAYHVAITATATRDLTQNVAITGDGSTEYEISYWYKGSGNARIWASWTTGSQVSGDSLQPASYNPAASEWTKMTYTVVPQSGANTLFYEIRAYSGASMQFDNFYVGVAGGGGGDPSYVPGYSNRTVAGTSQSVTGLTAGATYYFRARAVNGGGTSPNTSVASVTTLATLSAPVFGANPGPVATTAGLDTEFAVSASGVPTPTLSLDSTTAAVDSFDFDAGTGDVLYIAPQGDAGTQTFTFSAVNSQGSASQIVTVNVAAATAPAFIGGAGPYSTTVGVAVAFTVSASGTPAPTLALQSQTASSGYSFTPATGAFTYTPPAGDVGTPTFTFTAANAAGTVTQVTSVVVSAVPTAPDAPVAIWASATNATGFSAAWSSASGATSYRLDVATNETFSGGGGGGASRTNDCANVGGGSTSSYLTRTWTNNSGVVWNAYKARTDQTVNGNPSICLQNATGAYLAGDNIPAGIGSLSFDVQQMFTGSGGQLTVFVNGTQAGTFDYDATARTATFPDINVGTVTSLVISNNTAARPAINNLVWTDYGAGAPSFVPGYENRTVSGTSESVTGLVENTTYYFRVRAVNDIGSSGDSATGSVTTLEASAPGTPPTVDAIPAQIANVGVEFEYAVTATEPDADAVTFACTSAVDGGTWDFDENTGDFLFLPTVAQLGTNYFSFTATDKDGTSDPVQMGVKVYSAAASNEFTQWIEDREQDPVDPEFAPDGDADLDGTSNYDEFLADTDPANSNSVLKLEGDYYIASQVGEATGQIEFSFPASPNRFYQLEYCTDLTNHVTGVGFSGWGTPGPDGRMTITNNAVGTWYGVIRVRLNEP